MEIAIVVIEMFRTTLGSTKLGYATGMQYILR